MLELDPSKYHVSDFHILVSLSAGPASAGQSSEMSVGLSLGLSVGLLVHLAVGLFSWDLSQGVSGSHV